MNASEERTPLQSKIALGACLCSDYHGWHHFLLVEVGHKLGKDFPLFRCPKRFLTQLNKYAMPPQLHGRAYSGDLTFLWTSIGAIPPLPVGRAHLRGLRINVLITEKNTYMSKENCNEAQWILNCVWTRVRSGRPCNRKLLWEHVYALTIMDGTISYWRK